MENIIKEKSIKTSPEPVSFKATATILSQMNNCVCRIYINNCEGTGFFTKIPYKSKLLPVLITNNHIINQDDILNNNYFSIYLNNDKKIKRIQLNNNRLIYTNEKLDITIIEIKDNDIINNKYLELDNEIMNYFNLNKEEDLNYLSDIYSNNSIYLINYPDYKNIVVSYGQPPNFSESEIFHKCTTKKGSSGSPILLINNQKLIGIHYGSSEQYDFNKGRLLIYAIIEFEKIKNNLLLIDKEGKYININEKNNYIIAEFDIKEDNENIRIFNSYEKCYREHIFIVYKKEYENEEEIKNNCEIYINDELIPFSYFHNNKKGKYKIKYNFKDNIKNMNYMFCGCSSLTNIDLSNFNSNNAINMSCMFFGCTSLKDINLSNFKSNKVIDMGSKNVHL